jgi:hypothetical protein
VSFRVRGLNLLAFLIAACVVSGCERATKVRVEGGAPPAFVLTGSGNLCRFSVYLISPADFELGRTVDSLSDEDFFTEPVQWRFEAPDGLRGGPVGSLDDLTYGVAPPGYKQKIPADGSAPPCDNSGKDVLFRRFHN